MCSIVKIIFPNLTVRLIGFNVYKKIIQQTTKVNGSLSINNNN